MAYHIYTTEGFIIHSYDLGEAHKTYLIFTKDFGLLRAKAVSVRKINSKLRYSLQRLSQSYVSMIRIGDNWQLIDSQEKKRAPQDIVHQKMFLHVFALIRRFSGLHIEQMQLYQDVDDALSFLSDNNFSSDEMKLFEILIVFMILSHLGYIPKEDLVVTESINEGFLWSRDMLLHIGNNKKSYIEAINHSINATQL